MATPVKLDQLSRMWTKTKDYLAANYVPVSTLDASILAKSHPVGSIYMSIDPINPASILGGSWVAFAEGQMLVGVKATDLDFDEPLKTGGAKLVTLGESELPSHHHTIDHNHPSVDSGNDSASHYHGVPAMATGGRTAAHTHAWGRDFDCASGSSRWGPHIAGPSGAGATTQTGTESADHAHYTPATNTGGVSAYHTHSVDLPALTGDSGNAGSGVAHNNMSPYITVYIWKRTA